MYGYIHNKQNDNTYIITTKRSKTNNFAIKYNRLHNMDFNSNYKNAKKFL